MRTIGGIQTRGILPVVLYWFFFSFFFSHAHAYAELGDAVFGMESKKKKELHERHFEKKKKLKLTLCKSR